jgi:dienelactone hydrolase
VRTNIIRGAYQFLAICTIVLTSIGCADTQYNKKLYPCFDSTFEVSDSKSGVSKPVYCLSENDWSKPPVLLLHELPGLSSEALRYAEELSRHFTVYSPLMRGSFNRTPTQLSGYLSVLGFKLTSYNEWGGVEEGKSKIVPWLRHVVEKIRAQHEGQSIGVIGNCLTGALPLTLLNEPNIKAVVVAQPALPVTIFPQSETEKASLGISQAEMERAQESQAKIYGVRFEHDSISPPDKFSTLKCKFKERFIDAEIHEAEYYLEGSSPEAHKNSHSTLIAGYATGGRVTEASRNRREEIISFLKDPEHFRRSDSKCSESYLAPSH